jgi:hypothetical protein
MMMRLNLTPQQHAGLKALAAARGVPMSDLVIAALGRDLEAGAAVLAAAQAAQGER